MIQFHNSFHFNLFIQFIHHSTNPPIITGLSTSQYVSFLSFLFSSHLFHLLLSHTTVTHPSYPRLYIPTYLFIFDPLPTSLHRSYLPAYINLIHVFNLALLFPRPDPGGLSPSSLRTQEASQDGKVRKYLGYQSALKARQRAYLIEVQRIQSTKLPCRTHSHRRRQTSLHLSPGPCHSLR